MEQTILRDSVIENNRSQSSNQLKIASDLEPKTTAEEFLEAHYEFRRNVLRDVVEYRKLGEDEWHLLSDRALNSIFVVSKRDLGEDVNIKSDIKTYLDSDELQDFDPVKDWLVNLPEWDKQDRVTAFWRRIPGITDEQVEMMKTYHRSVVTHWLGLDTLHGNECVPVLISKQGARKSTFIMMFLPPELRLYFLDHFNLANKFDKEMALTNCLIINLDEMDKYSPKQMAEIKASLSKVTVNARRIYGKTIEIKHRYASFLATTNKEMPLTDPTGSRRFICIKIPHGQIIDVETEIEYEQMYAQLMYEIKVERKRYWFNDEETDRIQAMNVPFQKELNLEEMISLCYRRPKVDEKPKQIGTVEIQDKLLAMFPSVAMPQISTVKIGKAMKELDFEKHRSMNGMSYSLVEVS